MLHAGDSVMTPFFESPCYDKLVEPGTVMIAVMQSDLVRRHRLTVEEYFRMAEVGLLAPEARVELIEGEIFDMPPIGNLHGGLTAWLHRRLLRDLGDRISVWDQVTLPLDRFSAPEPDLVVLEYRQDEYKNKRPSPTDVFAIVEISHSSLHHDREIKLPLYARHGIPEVWIVDVARPVIHFFHTPHAGQFTFTSSTPAPGPVSLRRLAGATVDLTGLFDD
ncbi:MAG TPA: Uma2 family endonuclease [Steroidobacteraceae bacterium]|nr:Uma2 family endonuclease [Steroidobacteraceae bacterium]